LDHRESVIGAAIDKPGAAPATKKPAAGESGPDGGVLLGNRSKLL
jgi:hypothetical protein